MIDMDDARPAPPRAAVRKQQPWFPQVYFKRHKKDDSNLVNAEPTIADAPTSSPPAPPAAPVSRTRQEQRVECCDRSCGVMWAFTILLCMTFLVLLIIALIVLFAVGAGRK